MRSIPVGHAPGWVVQGLRLTSTPASALEAGWPSVTSRLRWSAAAIGIKERPASEASDPKFQDRLIAELCELTEVALPKA